MQQQPTRRPFGAAFDWLTKNSAATVTIGLVLYVLLRLPYSIYYGVLRTSPEEIGLSYVELLAQSTLAVAVLAAGGTVLIITLATGGSYAYLIFRYLIIAMAGYRSAVPKERRDGEWLEQDYVAVERARMQAAHRHLPSAEQIVSDAHVEDRRRRELDSLPTRTPEQQVEYEALSEKIYMSPSQKKEVNRLIVREVRSGAARMAPWVAVFVVILTIFALTVFFAPRNAASVRDCETPILGKFGLSGLRGEPAIITGSEVANLNLASGKLMLLGRGDKGYVFYNCDRDQTVRIPASDKIAVTTSG